MSCEKFLPGITPADVDIPFDRVTWRDGQPLTSRDMRDDKRTDDRLRWLHVRYLHGVWGIVSGLDVSELNVGSAIVQPGYAIDLHGRDLLSPEATVVPYPPLAGPVLMVLVMRYRPDCEYRSQPDLRGLCPGASIPPRDEHTDFTWKAVNDVELGCDVPLVGAMIVNARRQGAFRPGVRHYARGESHPRMFSGTTQVGNTGWTEQELKSAKFKFLQAVVDTAEAGFAFTPYYFAQLGKGDGSSYPGGAPQLFIALTRSNLFVARVVLAPGMPFAAVISAQQAERQGWIVSWLAIEAPPSLDTHLWEAFL